MGRHRAEPEVRRRGQRAAKKPAGTRRNPELLGWGLFLAGTTAACLLWARIPVPVTAGTSALLLAAFVTAWYASRTPVPQAVLPAPGTDQPAAVPSAAETPAAAARTEAPPNLAAVPAMTLQASVPPIPLAPGAAREFLTAPAPGGSGTQTSRWTRTFGPPDTGALPLQPYVPTRRASVQTADSEGHDRRQRSHSSL